MKNLLLSTLVLLLSVSVFSCEQDDFSPATRIEFSDNEVVLRPGDGHTVSRNEVLDLSVTVFDGTRNRDFMPAVSIRTGEGLEVLVPTLNIRLTNIREGAAESFTYSMDYELANSNNFDQATEITVTVRTRNRQGVTVTESVEIGLTE